MRLVVLVAATAHVRMHGIPHIPRMRLLLRGIDRNRRDGLIRPNCLPRPRNLHRPARACIACVMQQSARRQLPRHEF